MQNGFRTIEIGDASTQRWAQFDCDWRKPDTRIDFALYWRKTDGFGQLLPRPEPKTILGFYDVEYYTHGSSAKEANPGLLHKVIRHLAWRSDSGMEPDKGWWTAILGDEPKSVLEIGCGDGGTLVTLKQMGHNVNGIEPDPAAASECARKGLEVLNGTAEEIPASLAGRTFDVVLMMHVLEHCLDPEVALKNASDMVKDGGKLIVEVPNNTCKGRTFFGAAWLWLDVPRHLNFFSEQSLCNLFANVGLAKTRVEYRGYNRQFGEVWLAQQDRIAAALGQNANNSIVAQFTYLLRTFRAPASQKYDSVRVIATKPQGLSDNTVSQEVPQ